MGYSTDFTGELKFKKEATASELAELNKYLGRWRLSMNSNGWAEKIRSGRRFVVLTAKKNSCLSKRNKTTLQP